MVIINHITSQVSKTRLIKGNKSNKSKQKFNKWAGRLSCATSKARAAINCCPEESLSAVIKHRRPRLSSTIDTAFCCATRKRVHDSHNHGQSSWKLPDFGYWPIDRCISTVYHEFWISTHGWSWRVQSVDWYNSVFAEMSWGVTWPTMKKKVPTATVCLSTIAPPSPFHCGPAFKWVIWSLTRVHLHIFTLRVVLIFKS